MLVDFQYKSVRKYLEQKKDSEILDVFDKLADAAIIFTPVVFGAQFLPIWELLDVKDRLVDMGRCLIKFIAKQVEPTYIERTEQIKMAYGMICFTAYYEAFSELLPNDIVKELKGSLSLIIKEQREGCSSNNSPQIPASLAKEFHREIPFADETLSLAEVKKILHNFYEEISKNLASSIGKSDLVRKSGKKKQNKFKKFERTLNAIPHRALEIYEAQYIDLGTSFNDFGFYAQMCELNALNTASVRNETAVRQLMDRMNSFDIGMSGLATMLNAIPTSFRAIESQEIVEELKKKYYAEIEKPIIDDRENEKEIINNDEESKLSFPRIIDAFVPQAYKCLTYDNTRKEQKLEDKGIWEKQPVEEDVGMFLVKYLSSPTSIDYPLIILGHPGSGKSVLTKIISAQLMCDTYTVIRIPLREINADLDIVNIIEDQIKKDSQCALPGGYGLFAKQFSERPLIIIFDGYDELLQAKGQVFSGYLKSIHTYQQDQKNRKIPVRVIVTSRITLIDKAIIPENSSILRLLEFDEMRRNRWIDIWNRTNDSYFNANPNIFPFSLPKENKRAKSSIIELAEQPLLLLMLAIYDSEKNGLKELGEGLKRTVLYDNLLQRFVRRERSRYTNFEKLTPVQQQEEVTREMKRLGVVAIGMFNRKKLFVHSSELECDLRTYDVIRARDQLKDSDSLFGSFFFIHKSTAQDISNDNQETENAFEFLHNTFGEFLTADLILRYVVDEVSALKSLKNTPSLYKEYIKKLSDPNALCDEWFVNLMFTPLYSRPVVLEMIREHLPNILETNNLSLSEFTNNLQSLVNAQLKFFLKPQQLPNVILTGKGNFIASPILSYVSTYTMNLIILTSLVLDEGYVFNEDDYKDSNINDAEMRPWDKLISLWRAWFSSDNLVGLSAILRATRDEDHITVKCYKSFEANKEMGKVEIQLSVAAALSDEFSISLSGLQTSRFCDIMKMDGEALSLYLSKVDLNFCIAFITQMIHREINNIIYEELNFREINKYVSILLEFDHHFMKNDDALIAVLDIFEIALIRGTIYLKTQKDMLYFISRILENLQFERVFFRFVDSLKNIASIISVSLENSALFIGEDDIRPIQLRMMHSEFRRIPRINPKLLNAILQTREPIESLYYDDDRTETLLRNFSKSNMIELLKTNPNYALKLANIIDNKDGAHAKLCDYFVCFSQLVEIIGIEFINATTLLNHVKVAKKKKITEFIDYVSGLVEARIKNITGRHLSYGLYGNPVFLKVIYELNPEMISNSEMQEIIISQLNDYIEENHNRRITPTDIFLTFEFIELFRMWPYAPIGLMDNIFNLFFKRFRAEYIVKTFQNITIAQYNNLLWYSRRTGNKEVLDILKIITKEHGDFLEHIGQRDLI